MATRGRRSSYWALAAASSAPRSAAPAAAERTPANEFAQARAEATQAGKSAPPPPAVTPAAPVAKVDPISGVAQIESGYSYDPEGKRDPFRSFVWDRPDKMAVAEAGPLGQFDLSQLEVIAVVWRTGNARALVQDPRASRTSLVRARRSGRTAVAWSRSTTTW
jgi:type IV pilus assembly protein PilP